MQPEYGKMGRRPARGGMGGGGRGGKQPRPGPPREKSDVQKKVQKDKELQTRPARSWEVVRDLGKDNTGGLNGGVFVVRDRARGKEYIEKRARKETIANDAVVQEIIILKYLSEPSHQHITKMVDHYVDEKRSKASIYLEYCDVGGLDKFIKSRVDGEEGTLFNEMDVWEWFIQLFDALTYCHYGPNPSARYNNKKSEDWENSWDTVFHRDIKVDNILVSRRTPRGQTTMYTLKLADFGCAVARRHIWVDSDGKHTTNPWRTHGWEPPEHPAFVGRSDVWQLAAVMGCICNVMTMPFFDHANPASGYSQAMNNAIIESMAKDYHKRPKADQVLEYVRDKYATMAKSLQQTPMPVPANIDRAKRANQLRRGHEKLQKEIKREQQQKQVGGSARPRFVSQWQSPDRFRGAGNAGFSGGVRGGQAGFQQRMGGMGGYGNIRRYGMRQAPSGYESDEDLYGLPSPRFAGPVWGSSHRTPYGYGGRR